MELTDKLYYLAQKSDQTSKYAAIIIHRNKIIGFGYNHLIANSSISRYRLLRGLQT